ncbi:MAG: hypothetical protein JO317_05210, partial [Verrucomicrobiae bacterium]|nr:hypothetical protein [Verrucomicrobiae bacterium]
MPSTTRRRTTLGLPLCLFVFVCALLVALGARAATFYVDDDAANNNGDGLSAATAKHNITAALALCNPAGGDTVVILDGTYADPADQITLASLPANATSYTTLKAQNRWKVQIFQALACSQDSAARNYVALDGLRFLALGSHEFAGAHWKIQNCA